MDVRPVESLPAAQRIEDILVVAPAELIAGKVTALVSRQGKPRAYTDARDIAVLLLRFPELKTGDAPVTALLQAEGNSAVSEWNQWVEREIVPEGDEDF